MNHFTLDLGALDDAIIAADQALGEVNPEDSRLAIAVAVTRAVLPKILEQLEPVLAETRAEVASARAANAHLRDDMRAIGEDARSKVRRVTRVFEEIDPEAVAAQIIGHFETRGDVPDGRDRAFMRATVRHTIQTMSKTISLSLSVDEKQFNQL